MFLLLLYQSWFNSQLHCEQNEMEPLRIDSKEEESHFLSLIQQNTNLQTGTGIHVGGLLVDDKWKWKSDLSNVLHTIKWRIGEPNNKNGGENCLSIKKGPNMTNTGFNDVRCENHSLGVFCQKPKNGKASKHCVPFTTQEQIGGKTAKELDLERQLESQMGVCKLLNQALNTMLITGKDVSVDSTDSNNARKHKTVTVSVTSNEYEY